MTKTVLVKVVSLIFAVLFLLTCAACGDVKDASVAFTLPSGYSACDSKIISENDNYILRWDKDKACVLLEQKSDGYIWSTIPYNFYTGEESSAIIQSPIVVEYVDYLDNTPHSTRAYTASVKKKTFDASIKDEKLTVVFVLEDLEFSIPVIYSLEEGGLRVSIDSSEIKEGVNKLIGISVLPYLCSAENSDSKDSYVFVPSGSGALMYTDTSKGDPRTYSAEVYGDDTSRQIVDDATTNESIKMSVFGVKNGDHALFGVIDGAAETCKIYAETGTEKTGYSTVYPIFNVRAYDIISDRAGGNAEKIVYQYSDYKLTEVDLSVIYYPLNNEEANYQGMANKYWEHLEANGAKVSETEENMLSLNIIGGVEIKDFMAGIPYRNLFDVTTFSEAEEIVSEVSKDTGINPVVNLKGFASSGLNPGKVGGGFKYDSDYGSSKDLKNLVASLAENTSNYYFDFELIKFYKGGAGFSTYGDAAKAAKDQRAYQYVREKNVRTEDTDQPRYILLARNSIGKAVDKMINFANKKNFAGVSVGSLGTVCYSDNNDPSYYAKANMASQVTEQLASVRKAGFDIAVSDANAYAVANATNALNVCLSTDKSIAFDVEVPFYQMVFKGRVPMNSTAVNNSGDERKQILKAVSYGCGITYNIIYNYDTCLLDVPFAYLSSSVYEDNKASIKAATDEFADYYDAIKGATITGYEELSKDVSKTVFSNGVSVIVNISENDYVVDGETVKSMNYIMKGES